MPWKTNDNVLAETFPDMEINNSSGNVFAYNFCDDKSVQGGLLGCSINSNHGGHGSYNLYEGNMAPGSSATAIMAAHRTTPPFGIGSTEHPA